MHLFPVGHRIKSMPVLVLTSYSGCNSRCGMCDIWEGNATARQLSAGDVALQLDALRRLRVREVVLSGGEPLLHPDLWRLCELLRSLPARITLLSNGLLLADRASDVARRCDEVIVSLDGTAPTHDHVRGVPRAFDRLAAGVARVKQLAPRLMVTARCTLQRANFRELHQIVDAAHEIGLDGISFLAADVSSTAFNRSQPWDTDRRRRIALASAEVVEFRTLVDELVARKRDDFASGFIAESPAKLRRFAGYFAALNGDDRFPPVRCNAPWVSAVVDADGAVRPCFFQPAIGNLQGQPLDAIVNSTAAVAFRRALDVRHNETCRRCVCTLYRR